MADGVRKKKDFVPATRSPGEKSSSIEWTAIQSITKHRTARWSRGARRAGLTQRQRRPMCSKGSLCIAKSPFFVLPFKPPPFIHRFVFTTARPPEQHSPPRRSTRLGTLPLTLNREPLYKSSFVTHRNSAPQKVRTVLPRHDEGCEKKKRLQMHCETNTLTGQ